jgi:hypothetical protein
VNRSCVFGWMFYVFVSIVPSLRPICFFLVFLLLFGLLLLSVGRHCLVLSRRPDWSVLGSSRLVLCLSHTHTHNLSLCLSIFPPCDLVKSLIEGAELRENSRPPGCAFWAVSLPVSRSSWSPLPPLLFLVFFPSFVSFCRHGSDT